MPVDPDLSGAVPARRTGDGPRRMRRADRPHAPPAAFTGPHRRRSLAGCNDQHRAGGPSGVLNSPTPAPSTAVGHAAGPTTRRLYRDGALADGSSNRLQLGVSILVEDGLISWIRPSDGEEDPGPRRGGSN